MSEDIASRRDAVRILRERAAVLAREPVQPRAGGELQVLEFALAHERYAFETGFVGEVSLLSELTPLPCTPDFIAGIVNVRGRVLAVIDIRKFFDLPETGITDAHHIIVLRAEDMEIGVLADTVVGVRTLPLGQIQPSLPTLGGVRADYLRGVTAERLVVLDAARIMVDPRIVVREEVAGWTDE